MTLGSILALLVAPLNWWSHRQMQRQHKPVMYSISLNSQLPHSKLVEPVAFCFHSLLGLACFSYGRFLVGGRNGDVWQRPADFVWVSPWKILGEREMFRCGFAYQCPHHWDTIQLFLSNPRIMPSFDVPPQLCMCWCAPQPSWDPQIHSLWWQHPAVIPVSGPLLPCGEAGTAPLQQAEDVAVGEAAATRPDARHPAGKPRSESGCLLHVAHAQCGSMFWSQT